MRKFEGYMRGINFGLWLAQFKVFDTQHFEDYNKESDFKFVSEFGYDHIRLPFDYMLFEDTNLGFKYLDRALSWAKKYNLNLIFDLHRADGFAFSKNETNNFFETPELQDKFVNLWSKIAEHYKDEKDNVCFELLNEIHTDKIDVWNNVVDRTINKIRNFSKTRKIIVGSNGFNRISELGTLKVSEDKNIVYTFHFYRPGIFTHQKASWNLFKDLTISIPYPTPKDVYMQGFKEVNINKYIDEDITINTLEKEIKQASEFAIKNDVICYCGEYGVIKFAPDDSAMRWYSDVLKIFKKYNIGCAVWDYRETKFRLPGKDSGPNIELMDLTSQLD